MVVQTNNPRFDWVLSNSVGRILDVGSAGGEMWDFAPESDVTFLDINEYDIPNFVVGNAEELPFEDGSFDTVVLGEVLEHVYHPEKAMAEAWRVARDRVVFSVPVESEWHPELHPFEETEGTWKAEGLPGESFEDYYVRVIPRAKKVNDKVLVGHQREFTIPSAALFFRPYAKQNPMSKAMRYEFGGWVHVVGVLYKPREV